MSAKLECEKLMQELLPLAKRLLAEHGAFYPYAGWMREDGAIAPVASGAGEAERPKASEVITVLREHLTTLAEEGVCRAFALITDVRITLPDTGELTDAIQINLDHEDNYSVEVYVCYQIDAQRSVRYGRVMARPGEGTLFPR